MRTRITICLLLMLGVMLYSRGTAKAELITIAISGQVTSVGDQYNHFGGQIHVGDTITGTYTYDSTASDSYPSDLSYSQYYSPLLGISLNVDGLNFKTAPSSGDFSIAIRNDDLGEDRYSLGSSSNLPLLDNTPVQHISWVLIDPTGTALSSDDLPITAPDLTKWNYNVLSINTDRDFGIQATITSATPEPATLFLLGLGSMLIRKRFSK